MYSSNINNGEHRLTMTNIQSSIKVSFKLPKALLAGLFIMGSAMSAAHSELVIQEKDPSASVINQFATLKNATARSPQLHELIATLNQRLAANPNDALAWEILAKIYANNNYHDYAVYAANEAIELGQNTAPLKKILLDSSTIVVQRQLQSGYLDGADESFIKEYQHVLNKITGEIHGLSHDESLPKPPKIVRPVKIKEPKQTRKSGRKIKQQRKRDTSAASSKPIVRKPTRSAPVVKPITKPKPPRSSNTGSKDPFDVLRKN